MNQLNQFQKILYSYNPTTEREINIQIETLKQYNRFIEFRILRLSLVQTGLPAVLWVIVFMGAFVNIFAAWIFVPETKAQGFMLNSIYAITIGILVYAIAILDNPLRGEISVDASAFEDVFKHVMSHLYDVPNSKE